MRSLDLIKLGCLLVSVRLFYQLKSIKQFQTDSFSVKYRLKVNINKPIITPVDAELLNMLFAI